MEDEKNMNEENKAAMYAFYARHADEKQADDDKEIWREVKHEDQNEYKQSTKGSGKKEHG